MRRILRPVVLLAAGVLALTACSEQLDQGLSDLAATALEEVLPVYMTVRDRERSPDVALVAVVDKSGSMADCHCTGDDIDTALYLGNAAGYAVTTDVDGNPTQVVDINPRDGTYEGTDNLAGVENVFFLGELPVQVFDANGQFVAAHAGGKAGAVVAGRDPARTAGTSIDQHDIAAEAGEIGRSRQPRGAGADDRHVRHRVPTPWSQGPDGALQATGEFHLIRDGGVDGLKAAPSFMITEQRPEAEILELARRSAPGS